MSGKTMSKCENCGMLYYSEDLIQGFCSAQCATISQENYEREILEGDE